MSWLREGAPTEVYSNSAGRWLDGCVIHLRPDIVRVKYLNDGTWIEKVLPRNSDALRPCAAAGGPEASSARVNPPSDAAPGRAARASIDAQGYAFPSRPSTTPTAQREGYAFPSRRSTTPTAERDTNNNIQQHQSTTFSQGRVSLPAASAPRGGDAGRVMASPLTPPRSLAMPSGSANSASVASTAIQAPGAANSNGTARDERGFSGVSLGPGSSARNGVSGMSESGRVMANPVTPPRSPRMASAASPSGIAKEDRGFSGVSAKSKISPRSVSGGMSNVGCDRAEPMTPQSSISGGSADTKRLTSAASSRQGLLLNLHDLQFGSVLGSGGFGSVYRGTFQGSEVAIKKLHIVDGQVTPMQVEEFQREVATFHALRHPRLVNFIGAAFQSPFLCIVTEFMPNGSLYDFLHQRGQALSPSQRLEMAVQIAEGVDFLHSQTPPFVHRDLKSMNVVLDLQLNAKLCDFGLTQCMEKTHISRRNNDGGSPRYMAPELLDNRRKITEKVDVWALGCLTFEILTNQIPHEDCTTIQQLMTKMLVDRKGPFAQQYLTGVTQELRRLTELCLEVNPERRLSAAQFLAGFRIEAIKGSLAENRADRGSAASPSQQDARSAFVENRADTRSSASHIPQGVKVIDLGLARPQVLEILRAKITNFKTEEVSDLMDKYFPLGEQRPETDVIQLVSELIEVYIQRKQRAVS